MVRQIERETVINFEHESEMPDIGLYRQAFRVKRKTSELIRDVANAKVDLAGGRVIVDPGDRFLLEVQANLSILCEPVLQPGEKKDDEWLDNMVDPALQIALYNKVVEYQNSFYPRKPDAKKETTA